MYKLSLSIIDVLNDVASTTNHENHMLGIEVLNEVASTTNCENSRVTRLTMVPIFTYAC